MKRFPPVDYAYFVVYLVASVLFALLLGREQKSAEDNFLMGQSPFE